MAGSWCKASDFKMQGGNDPSPARHPQTNRLVGLILLTLFAATTFVIALPKESDWVLEQAAPIDDVPSPDLLFEM